MRKFIRLLCVALIVLAVWAAPPWLAQAASGDTSADLVSGQPDFSQNSPNNGGVRRTSLAFPTSVALDAQGNLYVADTINNRVLEYDAPLTTHQPADRVFGQPNFTQKVANNGGVSASSLNQPYGVALDAQGNLYVADTVNNRVLEYTAPLTSSMAAGRVFGQPSFITNTVNTGGVSASSLDFPWGVALDAQGNLYAADYYNNRVLGYTAPLTSSMAADRVFGQPNPISNTVNTDGLGPSSLWGPHAVALDAQGHLYVADSKNNRVLEYDTPLAHDSIADRVFGQADFTHNTANKGGSVSASSLIYPTGVALDRLGNLYVADWLNNRALEYNAPLTSDQAAGRVFGQPDYLSSGPNNPSLSAISLLNPQGVALDAQGNVYVADSGNNRVLEYDRPLLRLYLPLVMR